MNKIAFVATLLLGVMVTFASSFVSAQENELGVMQNFHLLEIDGPRQAKTFRRMEARDEDGKISAWLEVEAEKNGSVFSYRVLREDGSRLIRLGLKQILDGEKKRVEKNSPLETCFCDSNYTFPKEKDIGGMWAIELKPKRKDESLIDGILFLSPDFELVRSEGTLVKDPSFWTRNVFIVITYTEIAGIRVPISYESTANARFHGKVIVSVNYNYLSINGVSTTETK